jgi:hypothetical protein
MFSQGQRHVVSKYVNMGGGSAMSSDVNAMLLVPCSGGVDPADVVCCRETVRGIVSIMLALSTAAFASRLSLYSVL